MSEQSAIDALSTLWEAAARERGGEVVFRSGDDTGRVFFVGGRIAWATASTVKRTFLAALVENTQLERQQLKEVFDACRKLGGNFGETLLEWGLIDEQVLRRHLLEHLSDCLREVLGWSQLSSMFVPEERPYKGSLTFELREVLETVLALDEQGGLPFAGVSGEALMERAAARAAERGGSDTGAAPALPSEAGGPTAPEGRPQTAPTKRTRKMLWLGAAAIAVLGSSFGLVYALVREPPSSDASRSASAARASAADATALAAGATATRADGARPSAAATPDAGAAAAAGDGAAAGGDAAAGGQPSVDAGAGAGDAAGQASDGGLSSGPPAVVVGLEGEGKGTLKLLSVPKLATIYLDGVATRRRTPDLLRGLAAGVAHVVMLDRRGFAPVSKRFTLAAGMEATLRFKLRRVRRRRRPKAHKRAKIYLVSIPPAARIYVNRRRLASPTPAEIELDLGRASSVELRRPGYLRWKKRIRPVPEVRLSYRVKLRKRHRRRRRRRRRHRGRRHRRRRHRTR